MKTNETFESAMRISFIELCSFIKMNDNFEQEEAAEQVRAEANAHSRAPGH